MAFGFPAKFISTLQLGDLNPKQFLALAAKVASGLGWTTGETGENYYIVYTPFSISSWSEKVTITIIDEHAEIVSQCTGTQVADWGKNKRNVTLFIEQFEALRDSADKESFAEHRGSGETDGVMVDTEGDRENSARQKSKSLLSIFVPSGNYFVTPIIIDLNIAVFILMAISGVSILLPDNASLLNWGANFRPLTLAGQWWRLLTNCFLHIGIIHLVFNMYALLYIGLLLEIHLGKLRFAVAYVLTGIAASTASLWLHEMTISAGASGAIFGMYGVFLAMLTTNLIEKKARKTMLTSIMVFVVYNLTYGVKSGIDNAAHLGGLISGVIIGYAYYPSLKSPDRPALQMQVSVALSVIVIFCCAMVCRAIPNDIGTYDKKINEFAAIEQKALHVYSMKNSPDDSVMAEIKNHGLYYWNKNVALIDSLEKLHLPIEVHQRNQALLRYCNLRLKTYNLIYKAVAERTEKYKDSIDIYNRAIEDIVDSLKVNK